MILDLRFLVSFSDLERIKCIILWLVLAFFSLVMSQICSKCNLGPIHLEQTLSRMWHRYGGGVTWTLYIEMIVKSQSLSRRTTNDIFGRRRWRWPDGLRLFIKDTKTKKILGDTKKIMWLGKITECSYCNTLYNYSCREFHNSTPLHKTQ